MIRGLDPAARALAHVRARARGGPLPEQARVTVHFHPDRRTRDGSSTLRSLLTGGEYLSQFATGTSSGGLTAHTGGDRWLWESRLFGTAYDDAPATARPVYGSLNHRGHRAGGSIRFGSCHLRLNADVLDRTTFCWPDSVEDPVDFGVREACDLAALAVSSGRNLLDDHVEAHVHGGVLLARDVEALVLDPSFEEFDGVGEFPAPVEFHAGFALSRSDFSRPEVREFHAGFALSRSDFSRPEVREFRGPEVAAAGAALGERVTPAVIGAATWTGEFDEQTLKRVWHCLAHFGPLTPTPDR